MPKRFRTFVFAILGALFVVNCAKRGTITGGAKDETPPKFVKAFPPNFSTNFKKEEIKIYFDEFITLKDPSKQIIVSPPMDPPPSILPLGGASKFISIKFEDTLIDNTTYSINFGESVVDNNEGNPLSFFRYIFSTGNQLDSLRISGTVKDALAKKPEAYITVALYEINENFKDSLVYKEVPRYVTNTLDSIGFELQNLRKGRYKLIALKDKSTNYTYQPKQDKIGFYEIQVNLPEDTAKVFNITVFKEVLDFKLSKPKQVSKNEIIFGYEGLLEDPKIKILSKTPENFETRILKDKEKDTLHYWFKPFFKADSLVFEVTNGKNFKDTIVARFKDQYKDSLKLSTNYNRSLPFNEEYKIVSNTPIETIDQSKITLMDKDTVAVPFKVSLDKTQNEASILFERKEENKYELQLLPEAIKDYVGNVNDSLSFQVTTRKLSDYGKVFLELKDIEAFPIIVQVTNDKGDVIAEKYVESQKKIVFDNLKPAKYDIRVLYDANSNGKWDTGNFLKGIQPEKVEYYLESIDVRANWELKY